MHPSFNREDHLPDFQECDFQAISKEMLRFYCEDYPGKETKERLVANNHGESDVINQAKSSNI